jgi:predicted nucleotidyltransferase
MRLSELERSTIVCAIRSHDPNASIWLFGSRAKDDRRGGDIDIAILSERIGRRQKREIRRAICDVIGEQKLDLVVAADSSEPFFALVTRYGIRIDGEEPVA